MNKEFKFKVNEYAIINGNAKSTLLSRLDQTCKIIERLEKNVLYDYIIQFKDGKCYKVTEMELDKIPEIKTKFTVGDRVKAKEGYKRFVGTVKEIETTFGTDIAYGVLFDGFDKESWFWEYQLKFADEQDRENNVIEEVIHDLFKEYEVKENVYIMSKGSLINVIDKILQKVGA